MRLTDICQASRNCALHQSATTVEIGKWHYSCVLEGNVGDGLADPSWSGVNAQGIVDGLLGWFGAGCFTHMQGRAVGTAGR